MTKPLSHHQPPPRHRFGCWLVAFTSLLITFALIGLSLFLPPINLPDRLLAAQYIPLNAETPAISLAAGFRLSLPADASADDFAVKLDQMSATAFATQLNEEPPWLAAARQMLPDSLALGGPLFLIESRGDAPASLDVELEPPPDSPLPARLSLYGWNGESWRFVPFEYAAGFLLGTADFVPRAIGAFHIKAAAPIVLIAQEVSHDLDPEIAALATILSPAGLRPTLEGSLIGSLAPGGDASAPYLFMPLIRNFADPRAIDSATVESLISRPDLRENHIRRISDLAAFNNFDGVFIDYRGLSRPHRDDFARFITELAASFSQRDLRLGVVIAAEGDADGARGSHAYDWRRIGEAADYVQLRPIINPLGYIRGESGSADDLLRQVTGAVASNKVLLGLSARSVSEVGGLHSRIGWHDAFAAHWAM